MLYWMEAVIFIGIQGSGKSHFYRERFFNSHVRISLDLLKTRARERRLLELCVEMQQPFVIDNTNATAANRAFYIDAAKSRGFRVIGYFFEPNVSEALGRNEGRIGKGRVPKVAIFATFKRLQRPSLKEGFDELFLVKLAADGTLATEIWPKEKADEATENNAGESSVGAPSASGLVKPTG